MSSKLPFNIAACSGEDPDCPARELLFHSQDSKGWCTPRHCQYPQELVLRLDAPTRLTQIQVLCHEARIPAKVEILVGLLPPEARAAHGGLLPPGTELAAAHWKRLGFLSFDANERTQYSARELKTVALPGAPAQLVRFVVHRCHANALNPYNQAGLVALALMGEPMSASAAMPVMAGATPLSPITNHTLPPPPYGAAPSPPGGLYGGSSMPSSYVPANGAAAGGGYGRSLSGGSSSLAALAAEMNVDTVTAERIQELQQQKQQAVEREDYDEAKRLKGAVDRLRAAGGKIAALEARKAGAVQAEDYDLAKQLKQEIDRMRGRAYAAALAGEASGGELGGLAANGHVSDGRRRSSVTGLPDGEASAGRGRGSEPSGGGAGALSPQQSQQQQPGQQPQEPSSSGIDWSKYDDRPAVAKGTYDFAGAGADTPPPGSRPGSRRTSAAGGGSVAAPAPTAAAAAAAAAGAAARAAAGPPPPPGWSADLPPPEELRGIDAKEVGPLEELLGEFLVRCLFSKASWQLREAALARAAADLTAPGSELAAKLAEAPGEVLRTLARLLVRTLGDKMVGVYVASLGLLRALVEAAPVAAAAAGASASFARDASAAVGELLPVLVDKGADLNSRIREQACEALKQLLGVRELGVHSQAQHLLRPLEPTIAFKKAAGRLQLVSTLLPAVGLVGKGSSEGLAPEAVMEFAGPSLLHKEAVVRSAAAEVVLALGALVGPSVQRLLPSDLNPKLRDQIQAGLLSAGSQPPAAAAPSAAPTATSRAPAAAKPAAAAATVAPPAVRAAAPAPPAPPAAAAEADTPPRGGVLPTGDDDPALYAAELAAREARLGPHHPDVAEALSNLAIIHNQRGDSATALPLYERALAIWEGALGPRHPDVAHTLTDIAVIHLEQGRDDLGRPLLERALAIQEEHLGPDHPDVVAIRDVLQEEA